MPFVSNGTETQWVEEIVEVEPAAEFQGAATPHRGPLAALALDPPPPFQLVHSSSRGPQSATSAASDFMGYHVVYDPAGQPLLVNLQVPNETAYLPECPEMDYNIEQNVQTGKTIVTSPSVPFSAVVA